jgi:site-specific recombinase XerD
MLTYTFASWFMKRGGGDIWQLMKFLGHSEITTTMRYAHLSSDIKRVPSFDLAK